MTANEIVKFKTGLEDDAVVKNLVKMAEARIRYYLGYNEMDEIPFAVIPAADIAVMLYQESQATQKAVTDGAEGNSPVKSESFSEGGISTSYTYESATEQTEAFESRIANILDTLKVYQKGRVMFL